jgi:hypothetical protein
MSLKVSARAVPIALLALSSLWLAVYLFPLVFFLLFPATEIRQLTASLKNQQAPPQEMEAAQQQIFATAGHLKRAIPVGAFYYGSVEYKLGDWIVSRTTEVSYLAWLDRRSQPTILIITKTKVGNSLIHIHIGEGRPINTARVYAPPLLTFGLCLALYYKRNTIFGPKQSPLTAAQS